VFSFIIAIMLNPVVNYLCEKKINRAVAILISILLLIIFLSGLGYFIISQIIMFGEMLPELEEKIDTLFTDTIQWASQSLNISPTKINAWIAQMKSDTLDSAKALIGPMVLSMGALMAVFLLLPVYIFLILWYKELFLEFISKLLPPTEHKTVFEVLRETKLLIQNYLIGLLAETGIVAVMNVLGLILLGIEYAILIGVIGALLNLIPYIGGIVATVLTIVVVLATESPIYVLWVLILYGTVQFIDNNILMPRIVASKIKINEFVSIVAVLLGSVLWGIPGMFLSLPLIAILKVIFDRIEPLNPVGFLFGNTMSSNGIRQLKFSKKKVKVSNS
jgi:predicted PurR-regulated permease PerM